MRTIANRIPRAETRVLPLSVGLHETLLAATVLALLALASPARGSIPIDDFEIGEFFTSTQDNCTLDTLILNSYEPHVIFSRRAVTLCSYNQGGASARLSPGSELDDGIIYFPTGDPQGFLRLGYQWGFPRTLSYGGAIDRIEVDLDGAVPDGHVTIAIRDANGGDYVSRSTPAPGVYSFPLDEFEGVDVSMATGIQVDIVSGSAQGYFKINDIRLMAKWVYGPTRTVNFRGDFVAIQTPPIPSPPLSFRVFSADDQPLYRTDVTITRASAGPGFVPKFKGAWEETPALGGEISGMSFSWNAPTPYVDTDFELSFSFSPADGTTPEIVPSPQPGNDPGSFLLTFPVILRDAAGREVGRSETSLIFDLHAGQALKFENAMVTPGGAHKQESVSSFRVSFRLAADGNVDEGEPLFETTWIGDWTASPTGVEALEPAAAARPMTLVAWPSVTREGTKFCTDHPLAETGSVEIVDVSGRVVRRLSFPAGTSSIAWDGRDGRGQIPGSGTFLARISAGTASGTARVFLVR